MNRVYIETYGCQMNVADSELIGGTLAAAGYRQVDSAEDADVVLLNTCAVREKAEERIFGRLGIFKNLKSRMPGGALRHGKHKLIQTGLRLTCRRASIANRARIA